MASRKRKFILGGIGALILIVIVLNVLGGGDDGVAVRMETVQRRDLVATVTASGKIQPKSAVDVSADITGRIIQISVQEGDRVERGDLLIRIDPSTYESGVARAEAAVATAEASAIQAVANRAQAERALARTRELKQTSPNLVSDEQLEQAQTQFEVAQAIALSAQRQVDQSRAGLREARDNLAKTVLRAPMAGKVTRVAVEEGEVAVPGTFSRETALLMTVSDLSIIQVKVQVDETDVVRLHLGDSTDITIDAYPDTTFSGRVTRISQSSVRGAVSTQQGDHAVDYDVEVTLDNPPVDIRPDLSATAKIVTAVRDTVLSIPIIALTVREHTAMSTETAPIDTTEGAREVEGVFVVAGGTAQFRPVKVGIAGEEHFEILEGLASGDSIVAGPYQAIRDLRDSSRVRPMGGTSRTAGPASGT